MRVQPRRIANGDGYFVAVRFVPNGTVVATLVRLVGTRTKLTTVTVPGADPPAGRHLPRSRPVTGTSPSTLRAKVWKVGTPEPTGWTTTASDSTAGLQVAGHIGLRSELGTNSTNAPVRAFFDELWVGPTS